MHSDCRQSCMANGFGRYCMVDKQMAQQDFDDDKLELRNRENDPCLVMHDILEGGCSP